MKDGKIYKNTLPNEMLPSKGWSRLEFRLAPE